MYRVNRNYKILNPINKPENHITCEIIQNAINNAKPIGFNYEFSNVCDHLECQIVVEYYTNNPNMENWNKWLADENTNVNLLCSLVEEFDTRLKPINNIHQILRKRVDKLTDNCFIKIANLVDDFKLILPWYPYLENSNLHYSLLMDNKYKQFLELAENYEIDIHGEINSRRFFIETIGIDDLKHHSENNKIILNFLESDDKQYFEVIDFINNNDDIIIEYLIASGLLNDYLTHIKFNELSLSLRDLLRFGLNNHELLDYLLLIYPEYEVSIYYNIYVNGNRELIDKYLPDLDQMKLIQIVKNFAKSIKKI